MKCKSCNIDIITSSNYCPLCKCTLPLDSENTEHAKRLTPMLEYPHYLKVKPDLRSTHFFFIEFCLSLLCLFVNFFTFDKRPYFWSVEVISGFLFLHKSFFIWTSSIKNAGAKVILQFFWLSQLILVIDLVNGFSGWSLEYVIPWFSVGITFIITVLAMRKKENYTEYAGYMISSFFIAVLLAAVSLLPITEGKWGLLVALLYALLTFFALYLFSKPQLKNELKRRFIF